MHDPIEEGHVNNVHRHAFHTRNTITKHTHVHVQRVHNTLSRVLDAHTRRRLFNTNRDKHTRAYTHVHVTATERNHR